MMYKIIDSTEKWNDFTEIKDKLVVIQKMQTKSHKFKNDACTYKTMNIKKKVSTTNFENIKLLNMSFTNYYANRTKKVETLLLTGKIAHGASRKVYKFTILS